MSQSSLACLSLTANLRCVGFTREQFVALVIPPAIEVVISSLFIFLYSGPRRRAQTLLVADTLLYFVWALLDLLSHLVPGAHSSFTVFETLDFLVGAASFTPILVYSVYVYQLSSHDFIVTLPRNLQPCPEILLPILILVAVALNEVSSFVGTHLGTTSSGQIILEFSNNSDSLWLSLNQASLATYAVIQFLFFLLAFSRLSRAFLDQRRIELTLSDEHHFFNGIAWINAGIILGVVETIAGFTRPSFGLALARRIIRLVARVVLMYGLLKGLDVSESFESLSSELRGTSQIRKRVSYLLGVRPASMFRSTSQLDQRLSSEKQAGAQRVTVQYEKGQAPYLQIRFSTLDFPTQASPADIVQQRRRSVSGLIPVRADGTGGTDEMAAARTAVLETPRAKSALVSPTSGDPATPDWIWPPQRSYTRPESGGNVSDTMSVVRDLERRFPSLPPRVTGKYRGSILGQNYEEDPFPVVGVSRQSSMRRDGSAQSPSEEGGTSVALSSSGSIKRKPAPPLLDSITYVSDRRRRPSSTWGGLTQTTATQSLSPDSPMVSNTPWETTTASASEPSPTTEPTTPTTPAIKTRKRTAKEFIKRASRAVSDASIRSAEWFASASSPSPQPSRAPLTATDIEMYRRGGLGPGSARPKLGMGEAGSSSENLVPKASMRSAEDAKPNQPQVSNGKIPIQPMPIPTRAKPRPESEQLTS